LSHNNNPNVFASLLAKVIKIDRAELNKYVFNWDKKDEKDSEKQKNINFTRFHERQEGRE
jgi:hypothetical protein